LGGKKKSRLYPENEKATKVSTTEPLILLFHQVSDNQVCEQQKQGAGERMAKAHG